MLTAALSAKVLALVLSLPQCYGEARDVPRLTVVAESISAVADTPEEAAALVTVAEAESALCEAVHSGRRKGGVGEGLWQLEPGSRRHKPYSGTDLQSTTHAAGEALWLWRHTRGCSTMRKRFGAYAGLGCHSWPGAAKRESFYYWSLSVLSAG